MMQRVMFIGGAGSGKTTMAHALRRRRALAMIGRLPERIHVVHLGSPSDVKRFLASLTNDIHEEAGQPVTNEPGAR